MPEGRRTIWAYVWASKRLNRRGQKIGYSFNTSPMPYHEAVEHAAEVAERGDRRLVRVLRSAVSYPRPLGPSGPNFLTDDLLLELASPPCLISLPPDPAFASEAA